MDLDCQKKQSKIARLLAELEKHIRMPLPQSPTLHFMKGNAQHGEVLVQDWQGWDEVPDKFVWGEPNSNTWFATRIEGIPANLSGRVVAHVDTEFAQVMGRRDPQIQVWLNGQYYQAINGYHRDIDVPADWRGDKSCTLHLKAFKSEAARQLGFRLGLFWIDEKVERLHYDLRVPFDVACRLPATDRRKYIVLDIAERALRALDFRVVGSSEFQAALEPALAIADEIYALVDEEAKPTVVCTGHTHIDVAWQWTVAQTREKTVRSFSTILDLMDRHEDFAFMYNQCVLFNYLKDDAPDLYTRTKEKVDEGHFEIEGAMWLEPDMNIISGESIVRHILYGTRFHECEFGVTPKTVWLPDTFGYSASMPQILAKSGIEFFVTSKLSWNDTNRMPYDTFFWKGIDGSPIKSYLITAQKFEADEIHTTYQPDVDASFVMGTWKRYEPKQLNDEVLLVYGHGDGGGGPTDEMIEQLKRMKRGIPGCPNIKLEGIGPFFDRLGAKMDDPAKSFPVWNGELYLELHRGTLTSVARTKRYNRLAEDRLRDCELLGVLSSLEHGAQAYGAADIRRFWDVVMLQQFHDILPGTSISEVYEDSDRDYETLFAQTADYMSERVEQLTGQDGAAGFTFLNALGRDRTGEMVCVDAEGDCPQDVAMQTTAGFETAQSIVRADGRSQWLAPVASVPALGWETARLVTGKPPETPQSDLSISTSTMENEHLRVAINPDGQISSVWDKHKRRELLKPGETANRLTVYEDKPLDWEAWDVDWFFEQKSWSVGGPESLEVVETGPHRVALRICYRYQNSTIVQVMSLARNSAIVEFDTHVDWNENQSLLKAEFPFDLNCTNVRSEIQFGHVSRPTTKNTSWEQARFEASMHRWLDMSERDFGAAILNDCKYGYDADEQRIRITLIKSGIWPYPGADIGAHDFRYGLVVHHGVDAVQQVPELAEAFSNPLTVIGDRSVGEGAGDFTPTKFGLVRSDQPNASVQSIKKCEDSDLIIVRLCEEMNTRTLANIAFSIPVESAHQVDLLERNAEPLEVHDGNTIAVQMRPFEILTLQIKPDTISSNNHGARGQRMN